jgi:regulator of PEP synthase PpsR (kinase-PPPase family)
MSEPDEAHATTNGPPIFVVSGGVGASGEEVVRTVLAQFPAADVPVIIVPHVRQVMELEEVVEQASVTGGTIVHTLVDANLRQAMISLAQKKHVVAIDLMGPLVTRLIQVLGQEPIGQPGLYRQLRESYLKRVEAIEFTVAHDDGQKPHDLPLAEIVLAGVSRVGKTPLSMYLSVLGWKVANVPLILEVPPPQELFRIDPRRVVGLTIDPDQLLAHRQWRQRRLGVPGGSLGYTDPARLYEEAEAARRMFRTSGFAVVDVTDKPIESSAEEIITLITRRRAAGG